ncbi:MAG: hypothetical protein KatS3mg100_535 [Candidatus Parcubacteria bacterium]|nr:MAG: hypothetical protein KatS3mg100_535 [Candidatus Parcubacteria bacterium]
MLSEERWGCVDYATFAILLVKIAFIRLSYVITPIYNHNS